MDSELRRQVWDSMLDAEMYEYYWGCEAQRLGQWERWLIIGNALLSSSTVVALFTTAPPVGRGIAVLAAVGPVVQATMFSRNRMKQIASLCPKWKELAIEFRVLWGRLKSETDGSAKHWDEYRKLSLKEKQLDDSAFPVNRKRMKSAQRHVLTYRGI